MHGAGNQKSPERVIRKDQKVLRFLAWLPARLYELVVRLRVAAYETSYLKSRRLEPTVISVGNLTVGGTGKTPMVGYIARYLAEEGHDAAILTRGYGRNSTGLRTLNVEAKSSVPDYREFGDEAVMMSEWLPEIPILISGDRWDAGNWASRELKSNVLILDDAYQHLRVERDLNILLLDATDPFGGFEMVPFGRLREPLYGIKRADAVIVTRADRPFDEHQTTSIIKHFCRADVPILYFYSSLVKLRHLQTGDAYEISKFRGWNVAAMCGIGNPEAFADELLQVGINIVAENFYKDHHPFSVNDLQTVAAGATAAGADAIITTEKDAVRLRGIELPETPVYAAVLELRSEDEVRFKSLLLRTVHRNAAELKKN